MSHHEEIYMAFIGDGPTTPRIITHFYVQVFATVCSWVASCYVRERLPQATSQLEWHAPTTPTVMQQLYLCFLDFVSWNWLCKSLNLKAIASTYHFNKYSSECVCVSACIYGIISQIWISMCVQAFHRFAFPYMNIQHCVWLILFYLIQHMRRFSSYARIPVQWRSWKAS